MQERQSPKAGAPVPQAAPVPAASKAADGGGADGPLAVNIAKYESKGGYNAYNRGTIGNTTTGAVMGGSKNAVYMDTMTGEPMDFSKMTIEEFLKRSRMQLPHRIFTVGKYQVIPITMIDAVASMKLDPKTTFLNEKIQERIFSEFLIGSKPGRSNIKAYLEGQSDDINAAVLDLAMEFASVGVPYDIRAKSMIPNQQGVMTEPKNNLKRGASFYAGVGGNAAHNPLEHTIEALQSQRKINLAKKEGGTRTASAPTSTGEMGQVTSGTSLANAGQTQYDKNKNTKTNVIIVPKANNKTNNIEDKKAA